MASKKISDIFASMNVFGKTSSVVAVLAGITGILSWIGITPDFITKKNTSEKKTDTILISAPVQPNPQGKSKLYGGNHENKKTPPHAMPENKNTSNGLSDMPDFISNSYKNTTVPFEISLIVKNKNSLDQKFAVYTGYLLTNQGIKCNAVLFTNQVLSHFDELESSIPKEISGQLTKYTKWYLIGELEETERDNPVNPKDKTAIVSFSGYLMEVSESGTTKQINIAFTEKEAGMPGMVIENARKKLSQRIVAAVAEHI
jgi:hypothetical protein